MDGNPIPPPGYAAMTMDPFGNLMYGLPVTPAPAYPNQYIPPPYLYQPPPAFYAPPAEVAQHDAWQNRPPPPYYYGAPVDYAPPPYSPPVPQTPMVAITVAKQGTVQDLQATQSYAPTAELTADFSDHEFKVTNQPFSGDYNAVTHLNYYSNFIERIENLAKYPNLMRLTLRENNIETLNGIDAVPYLRWLDVSNNYLSNFSGMGEFPNLEWLDCTNNNIENFHGLHFAPNLTWLCAFHNHLKVVDGIQNFTSLRWLDISDSDLGSVRGLEKVQSLQEVNMANNYLDDVESVKALANLPYLFRIDIFRNNFEDSQVQEIVQHFRNVKPQCEVITTQEQAEAVGHNLFYKGKVWKNKPGQGCNCSTM